MKRRLVAALAGALLAVGTVVVGAGVAHAGTAGVVAEKWLDARTVALGHDAAAKVLVTPEAGRELNPAR